MHRRILYIASILLILSCALDSHADVGLEEYRNRRASRLASPLSVHSAAASQHSIMTSSPSYGSFSDIRLNNDDLAERFVQRYADIAILPDGSYVVVWEDDRNGDTDIFAQIYTPGNIPSGPNVLIATDVTGDQRLPACDANESGNLVIAWIGPDGNLHGQVRNSTLSAATDAFVVNDDGTGNSCNFPDVCWLDGGAIAFVWEDVRTSDNIYCQLYSSSFTPSGDNFRVNSVATNASFWAPKIASAGSSGFAVSWEEVSWIGSSVVMKTFAVDGTPYSSLVSLPDPSYGFEDQFQSTIANIAGVGYVVSWIDMRLGSQAVYSQIVDYSGYKNGSNFLISDNPSYVCWDASSSSGADGSVTISWASYGERAEILATKLDSNGDRNGANFTISDPALFCDRYYPRLDIGSDNSAVAVWTDYRDYEADSYLQRLSDAGTLVGSNWVVFAVDTGCHQIDPSIALVESGTIVAAWEDYRNDAGDIYFQLCNSAGSRVGENTKVNQDIGGAVQSDVSVASDGHGSSIVVWQDSRTTDGMLGTNIYGRKLSSVGSPDGDEFLINDDISTSKKTGPDVDRNDAGWGVVTWIDERDGGTDVYMQLIEPDGPLHMANEKITTTPQMSSSRSAKAGIGDDRTVVIAWLGETFGRYVAYYQLVDSASVPVGPNSLVDPDTNDIAHGSHDLAVFKTSGEFVIAWSCRTVTGLNHLYAQRFTASGLPSGGKLLIASTPDYRFEDVSVACHTNGAFAVCWVDSRTGISQSYLVMVTSNDMIGSAEPTAYSEVSMHSGHPALAMDADNVYAAWFDNRNKGAGYDIFVNTHPYVATDADEPRDIIVPGSFALRQNYPNPFNPTTSISFYIPSTSRVRFEVCDVLGRTSLARDYGLLPSGWHEIAFDASGLPSGVYFYRVSGSGQSACRKMVLVK